MADGKKIVLIGPAHPFRGGLATFNERLIREFRKRGDDASVCTFTLQYPSIFFPGKTQYSTEPAPADIPIRARVNSVNPFNWLAVGKDLKRQRPDYVIFKYWIPFMAPCFGSIARIIRRNGHTRIISILDNLVPHEKRAGDKILSRFWVNSVDGFVAMSKSVLDDIGNFEKNKPRIFCPHPLYDTFGEPVSRETALGKLGLDPDFRYILFFGFIREYKGLDLLIRAMADDRIRALPVRLIVAGEFYCDPAPYTTLIREVGLEERIIMSNDFIPDSQVVNYFCAADLVAQPYKSATQSGVTQIAYHFNKPMIVTGVGGLAEIVPHGKVGYVVEPEPSAISEALAAFYSEGRGEEFSKNAALEKERYSWQKMTEAIDKLAENDHTK
jgi:glycosyltransferase involved in cell wall biosynthesis